MVEKKDFKINRIAVVHNNSTETKKIASKLDSIVKTCAPEDADVIIVIGGDGSMLNALHKYMHLNIPFYGINAGSIGFLMNSMHEENFLKNLENSKITNLYPLEMKVINIY